MSVTLGGDRARELSAKYAVPSTLGGDRSLELAKIQAARNVSGGYQDVAMPGTENATTDSATTGSSYSALLEAIKNRSAPTHNAFPGFQGPSMSAAARAAMAVDGKYTSQANALNRQKTSADQDLALGVNTQQQYGQIGDTKLAAVYGDLNKVANETAARTNQVYADAKTGVDKTYADASATQAAAANTANSDVANTAGSLGLQAAVTDATQHLNNFTSGAQAQLATDRAAGVSNIITLGANMGAAALKDVNIMAQLGADSRRDLVTSVQATLANLQQQHDKITSELAAQMTDLESERQNALQNATYQYEADDADKKYKYDMAKYQAEADNQSQQAAFEHQNLSDTLSLLKAQQDELESNAGIDATKRGQTLDENKNNFEQTQQLIKNKLEFDKAGLDYKKYELDVQNTGADNANAAAKTAEDTRHNTEVERINKLNATTAQGRLAKDQATAAEKIRYDNASLALKNATLAASVVDHTADNARADAKAAQQVVDAKAKAKVAADKEEARILAKTGTVESVKGLAGPPGVSIWAKRNNVAQALLDDFNTLFVPTVSADSKVQLGLADPAAQAYELIQSQPSDKFGQFSKDQLKTLAYLYYKK